MSQASALSNLRSSLGSQSARTPRPASARSPVSAVPSGSLYKATTRPKSMSRGLGGKQGNHMVAYVLWFIIVFLLTWIVLYAFSPSFVLTNDELDSSKVILWSLVISLIVVTIVSIVYTEQKAGQKLISLNF